MGRHDALPRFSVNLTLYRNTPHPTHTARPPEPFLIWPPLLDATQVNEVSRAVAALDVDTVIFDDELSPGQLRNLEKALAAVRQEQQGEGAPPVRVCDRTALILDIFSQRAQTREGQLQVGRRGGRGEVGKQARGGDGNGGGDNS